MGGNRLVAAASAASARRSGRELRDAYERASPTASDDSSPRADSRSRRTARRVRRLRRVRAGARRRPPRLLRALRAPAPRPGVRRHRHVRGRPHHDPARPGPRRRRSSTSRSCARSPATWRSGHVRYSTTGSSAWENAQPIYRSDRRDVALAHNGNLINAVELHAELREQGVEFRSTSDSEIIAAMLSTHEADTIEEAIADVVPRLEGAFSTVVMTHRRRVRVPRPAGPAAAGARPDRRPLLRRLRELRVRHHRRRVPARGRSPARWSASARAASRPTDRRRGRAPRVLRLRAHLLRAPRLDARGQAHRGVAPPDGRDPLARGAGRGRPRRRRARLGHAGRRRLRGRVGHPARRRARQEPLRRAHVHPARPGAAQARPADEVQPAARGRRRQAPGRRRRLDRARQHHAPDHRDAARRGRDRGAPAHLRAADPPPLPLRRRHVDDARR